MTSLFQNELLSNQGYIYLSLLIDLKKILCKNVTRRESDRLEGN